MIFLSYRRDDAADITDRIYESLVTRFGRDCVFMDVDSMPPGVDFPRYLDEQVSRCRVFVTVIGRRWLELLGERQRDVDFVRIEVESALCRKIPIIPLLVQGVDM